MKKFYAGDRLPREVKNHKFWLSRKRAIPLMGFTLVETLLAVLVLMVALAGPLTIASKALNTALVAKDRTIALYLAQDAMEYVRFARDTNRLTNHNWLLGDGTASLTNLGPCVSADGVSTCYIDSTGQNPTAITSCAASDCSAFPIYVNAITGMYTYESSGNKKTIFIRTISITTPPPGIANTNDALVTVTVTWKDIGSVLRSVVLVDNLLDWQ